LGDGAAGCLFSGLGDAGAGAGATGFLSSGLGVGIGGCGFFMSGFIGALGIIDGAIMKLLAKDEAPKLPAKLLAAGMSLVLLGLCLGGVYTIQIQ